MAAHTSACSANATIGSSPAQVDRAPKPAAEAVVGQLVRVVQPGAMAEGVLLEVNIHGQTTIAVAEELVSTSVAEAFR